MRVFGKFSAFVFVIAAIAANTALGTTLFSDDFNVAGEGAGSQWTAATYSAVSMFGTFVGAPDVTSSRTTVGGQNVYWMRSSTAGANLGVQTANAISVAGATDLNIDMVFASQGTQANVGAMCILASADGSGGVRMFTQDWNNATARADGTGAGGTWYADSGPYGFTPGAFYHFVANITGEGSTVSLLDAAGVNTLWTASTPNVTVSDLGSAIHVVLGQNGNGSGAMADVYVDSINITGTVPEPGAMVLAFTGVIGLLAYAWRKRK